MNKTEQICYDKRKEKIEGVRVEYSDDANMEVPSERFIRQVVEELSRMGGLDKYGYPEILSKAFTYLNLIH